MDWTNNCRVDGTVATLACDADDVQLRLWHYAANDEGERISSNVRYCTSTIVCWDTVPSYWPTVTLNRVIVCAETSGLLP